MKLQEQKKLGFLYIVIGAVLLIVGLLTAGNHDTWFTSFGGALMAVGAIRLLRVYRLSSSPAQAADYEASLQDERTAYVVNKARSMTFIITIYIELIAALAAILIFKQTLLGQALCMLACAQSLIFTGCYWYFNKKF
ncbi:MAG: hypothetical protein Q4C54_09830 [Clostridia bacterium]|nr:hypothetical protein [Clostridia bacterium]